MCLSILIPLALEITFSLLTWYAVSAASADAAVRLIIYTRFSSFRSWLSQLFHLPQRHGCQTDRFDYGMFYFDLGIFFSNERIHPRKFRSCCLSENKNRKTLATRVTRRTLLRVHVLFFALNIGVLFFFAKWAHVYSFPGTTKNCRANKITCRRN